MTPPAFESNLFDFLRGLDCPGLLDVHVEDDVYWVTSTVPFPLFNGALNARFAPESAARRTHEVLDRLMEHGHPFLWWVTPSTRSHEMEAVLVDRGLAGTEPSTAMTLDLTGSWSLHEPEPDGVTLELLDQDNAEEIALAMLDAFGFPHFLAEPFMATLINPSAQDRDVHNLLARLEGAPVGAGSLVVTEGTIAGLYNIAVREEARGRGIGRALTLALMKRAADLGCTESILHATPMGRPVYARLGYQPVAEVGQYAWAPPAEDSEPQTAQEP